MPTFFGISFSCSITSSLDFIDDQVCGFLTGTEIDASNNDDIVPFGVGEFAREAEIPVVCETAVADSNSYSAGSIEGALISLESAEASNPPTGMKARVRTTLERINSTGKRISARFSVKSLND